MANESRSRRPSPKRGGGVVEPNPPNPWGAAFVIALLTAAAAIGYMVFVSADTITGGSDDTPVVEEPTAVKNTAAKNTSTQAQGNGKTVVPATAVPGATDAAQVVKCGDILAPLDKNHRLAEDCAPGALVTLTGRYSGAGTQQMTPEAADAFMKLVDAAKKENFTLFAVSSYRSYAGQISAYNSNVASYGQEYADRSSAKPGHSEHQLGTTTDVASDKAEFEDFNGSQEAAWLADNSWKFGFIVSYPPGKEAITGYTQEDWHIRYVGVDVAKKVRESGLTLHEFLLK